MDKQIHLLDFFLIFFLKFYLLFFLISYAPDLNISHSKPWYMPPQSHFPDSTIISSKQLPYIVNVEAQYQNYPNKHYTIMRQIMATWIKHERDFRYPPNWVGFCNLLDGAGFSGYSTEIRDVLNIPRKTDTSAV